MPLVYFKDGNLIYPFLEFSYVIPSKYFTKFTIYPDYELLDKLYGRAEIRDKVILDIGAYIGDSVFYFLHKGARHVIAIEPVPEHFEILQLSTKNLPVTCLNCSVGGRIPLANEDIGKQRYGLRKQFRTIGNEQIILSTPCDDIAKLVEQYNVDIIKMNCEGCEYHVVDDIISIFKNSKNNISHVIIQFHKLTESNFNTEEIISYLSKHVGEPYKTFEDEEQITVMWIR